MSASTQHPTASKPSVLGIVSLVIAVVALVCAWIPGLFLLGAFLLPIAFVLSIVALFLKGRKWPALVGLVLSIAGVVLVIALITGVIDEALAFGRGQGTLG